MKLENLVLGYDSKDGLPAWQCQNSLHLYIGLSSLCIHFLVDLRIHLPYYRCRLIVEKQISIQSPHHSYTTYIQQTRTLG
jgi:hypothetical protein